MDRYNEPTVELWWLGVQVNTGFTIHDFKPYPFGNQYTGFTY